MRMTTNEFETNARSDLESVTVPKTNFLQKQQFADVLQNRCSLKFRNIYRKIPVLESFINKGLSATLLKRGSNTGVLL